MAASTAAARFEQAWDSLADIQGRLKSAKLQQLLSSIEAFQLSGVLGQDNPNKRTKISVTKNDVLFLMKSLNYTDMDIAMGCFIEKDPLRRWYISHVSCSGRDVPIVAQKLASFCSVCSNRTPCQRTSLLGHYLRRRFRCTHSCTNKLALFFARYDTVFAWRECMTSTCEFRAAAARESSQASMRSFLTIIVHFTIACMQVCGFQGQRLNVLLTRHLLSKPRGGYHFLPPGAQEGLVALGGASTTRASQPQVKDLVEHNFSKPCEKQAVPSVWPPRKAEGKPGDDGGVYGSQTSRYQQDEVKMLVQYGYGRIMGQGKETDYAPACNIKAAGVLPAPRPTKSSELKAQTTFLKTIPQRPASAKSDPSWKLQQFTHRATPRTRLDGYPLNYEYEIPDGPATARSTASVHSSHYNQHQYHQQHQHESASTGRRSGSIHTMDGNNNDDHGAGKSVGGASGASQHRPATSSGYGQQQQYTSRSRGKVSFNELHQVISHSSSTQQARTQRQGSTSSEHSSNVNRWDAALQLGLGGNTITRRVPVLPLPTSARTQMSPRA